MKKIAINPSYGFKLFLSATAIVFLLPGCCFLFGLDGAKKPCNCKEANQPAYAVNKNMPAADVINTTTQTALMNNKDASMNSSMVTSGMDDAVNVPVISAEPIVVSSQASQPVLSVTENITNSGDEQIKSNDVIMPASINRYKTSEKKLPLGIKGISTSLIASPNLSFKSSQEDYGNTGHQHNPGVGFQFGIGTTYMFSRNFSVSTSLLFKQNNSTEVLQYSSPGNPNQTETESKYSYSYISAPLLAEVKLSNQLTASVGPEINLLTGASVKNGGNDNGGKTSITDNSVKVGAGVQAGIKYNLPNSPLAIQLVYDHRISRLNKKNESGYEPGGGSYDTPAWNMKSIQLGITCDLCELMKK